uniref:Uncharacterized protein n=1 Tax=Haplochromis burtoni TaxID=8153 RepID=A0A3Q2WUQ3_HAPBU
MSEGFKTCLLMQQGIERDWKQCHTKYKNLKYLYRSLQRGKTDEADPRRLMRFYEEVDSIMNRTANDSLRDTGAAESADSGGLTTSDNCDDKNHVDGKLTNTRRAVEGALEDKTCTSDSDLSPGELVSKATYRSYKKVSIREFRLC